MYEARQLKKTINHVIGREYINTQESQVKAIQRKFHYYRYMNKAEAQINNLEVRPPKWIGNKEDCINSKGDKNHDHLKEFDNSLDLNNSTLIRNIEGDEEISDNVIGVKRSEPGNYGLGRNAIINFNNNITKEIVWHKVKGKSSNSKLIGGMYFVPGIRKK